MSNLHNALQTHYEQMKLGNVRSLAKLLTAIENEDPAIHEILSQFNTQLSVPVIGITGPPGAGKSSLVNALIDLWVNQQSQKVAILAIDPSSPFNLGALLGDRLRMAEHFTNHAVFIRSMATRGALGGLSHKIVEAVDLLKHAGFDKIIVETVGVGQSEIEIAGLADTTVLVLVPEAGDDVQAIKSGIMEIGDIFVVNKADRMGADTFVKNLKNALHQRKPSSWNPPVVKTIATKKQGLLELSMLIDEHAKQLDTNPKKIRLLAEKAWKLIAAHKMKNVEKESLELSIKKELDTQNFNLYTFVKEYTKLD
jgi:LAO/AO transport system kinase